MDTRGGQVSAYAGDPFVVRESDIINLQDGAGQ